MTKFSDLKLDPKVLQAVAEAGYETPTPIQAGAIPPALEGRDVLGIAQTGTGKTAGFVLPMITLLGRGRARARMPRSLVLCPTRELAAQVAENFDTYAKHTRLTKALLIGGVSFGEQDKLIDRGVDVLIATPGRLLDHFERGKLLLTGVQIMVVDEADRMLDMGFIPDIERIFQLTPPLTRQTLFFSATMAPEIERITNTFLHNPERIEVARQATTSETIVQKLVEITPTRKDQSAKQKRELLRALIDAEGPESEGGTLKNAIIFCNRKTEVDIVAKSLKAHGYDAAPIHGDLDQSQRTRTLEGFRDGSLRFLIASDVAARGLDIPAVSHVFNFDLPSHAEDYVHRIGRTGRAGRTGTAISIATPADDKYLAAIENLVKQTLPRAPLPEGFSLTDAAMSPPRPPAEGGGSAPTSRTRSRVRGERKPVEAAPLAEPAVAAPELAEQPEARVEVRGEARPDARPEPRPEPRRRDDDRRDRGERQTDRQSERPSERQPERGGERNGDRGTERTTDRGDERRERANDRGDRHGERNERGEDRNDRRGDRNDDRRGDRGRDRDRGPAVMGMGEHVPDFMLTSFTASIAATAARIGAAEAAEALAPALEPQANPASEPQARQAGATDTPPMTQDGLDAHAEAATPAEAAPVAEPVAEAPAKPKRTRTRARKKPVEAAPEGEAAQADAAQDAPAQADAAPEPAAGLPEEREAVAPDAASAEAAPAVAPADALPEEREATAPDSVADAAPAQDAAGAAPATEAPGTADADVPQAAPSEPPMTQDGLDAHDPASAPAGDQPQPVPSGDADGEPPMTEDGLDAHADPDPTAARG